MLPLVDSGQMMELDEAAVRRYAMPSILLMENAGRCVVDEIERRFGPLKGSRILVLAGKGKNGGDGFVAARHAVQRGASAAVLLVAKGNELQGDAKTNYEILRHMGDTRLTVLRTFDGKALSSERFDYIIDAIFGTSFRGQITGSLKDVVDWINSQRDSKIIAVDIPSGVNASTGETSSTVVRARLTITMALPKTGLFLGGGRDACGSIAVADIQMPAPLVRSLTSRVALVEEDDIRRSLPVRAIDAQKQSVGKIFVLAGSKGMAGAALLCSQSAMKSGAGAVVLAIPSAAFPAVSRRTLEVMPLEIPSTEEGSAALSSMALFTPRMKWADIILLGPGLTQNAETVELVEKVISTSVKTLVIDADGLNALAGNITLLKKRKCASVILTPHLGEFSRLTSLTAEEIEKNKLDIARSFARKHNVVLVLKGASTLVAAPDGNVYVNSTGNAGMATAGSGDVLAGIIAALAGQHNSAVQAAVNGVDVHGRAGDIARDECGEMGMLASDILRRIPSVLRDMQMSRAAGLRSERPR